MRSVIFCRTSQSIRSMVAVIALIVLIARMMTIYSKHLALFFTPTDLKSGTTVKYCHTFLLSPAFSNFSRKIAPDSLTASKRSLVIASRQRTPKPAYIVVRLYHFSCFCSALNNFRINRALS